MPLIFGMARRRLNHHLQNQVPPHSEGKLEFEEKVTVSCRPSGDHKNGGHHYKTWGMLRTMLSGLGRLTRIKD